MRKLLFVIFLITLILFTYFSYVVAKERLTQWDFDTTVKVQDRMPERFIDNLSIFSLLGSAEITIGFCLIMIIFAFLRFKWLAIMGWLMIIPASVAEVFGKLMLYHPGPPVFFHKTNLDTHLPSFYVHTEFSYPSGHMTRTIFIITILICILLFSKINSFVKYFFIALLLGFGAVMTVTRVSLGEHWPSDVVGGLLLGVSMGCLAAILILSKKKKLSIETDSK